MTSSVLCAVDVSNGDDDLAIVQKAAEMAALEGSQLDVVAVVPDFGLSQVGTFFNTDHHDEMVAESKTLLEQLVTKAIGAEQNEKVRHVIATGKVYEEVIELAATTKARLVVIGAHKQDLSDYLLGTNASRIVRHATCSVMVVR